MSRRNRIFIGLLLVYVASVAWLMWRLLGDIDPRYRESAEESLVETAHLLASLVEQQTQDAPQIDVRGLEPLFRNLYARQPQAQIFGFVKDRIEMRLLVVDAAGLVLFDSTGRHQGENYERWRDVRLALAGDYGARTSPDLDGDPSTSVMYVAAPVRQLSLIHI